MAKALRLSIVLAALLVALPASAASLLTNGSFEDTNNTAGLIGPGFTVQSALGLGGWNVYTTMPGWYSGPNKGFELQRNTVVTAQQGTNYIELESHPGNPSVSQIMQNFTVAAGDAGVYLLSFYYRPRTTTPGDNLINALFDGNVLTTVSGPPAPPHGVWTLFQAAAHLTVGSHTLEFNAFGTLLDNTLGGFIDNASVELIKRDGNPIVPLPAGLILLLSGLGGLGFLSRARAKTA